MCGRFNVVSTPGLNALAESLGIHFVLPESLINVAPTESVPLIHAGTLSSARWWLTPSWAQRVDQRYAMFNARSETLHSSRAFRGPFERQRGIVLMSSFIEWRLEAGKKTPWLISSEEEALAIAALWDVWQGDGHTVLSCTLVTTEAAPQFRPWHSRMPVMLTRAESRQWLDIGQPGRDMHPLFNPVLKFPLRLSPLVQGVGNSRNKSMELMEQLSAPTLLLP